MASPSHVLTRRAFAGLVVLAGPIATARPTASTAAPAAQVSPALAEMIEAHRSANLATEQALADCEAADLSDDPASAMLLRIADEASDAEVAALNRVHAYTPASLAEFLAVVAYFAEIAAEMDPQGFGSWLTTGLHAMAGRMASC